MNWWTKAEPIEPWTRESFQDAIDRFIDEPEKGPPPIVIQANGPLAKILWRLTIIRQVSTIAQNRLTHT